MRNRAWWFDMAAIVAVIAILILCQRLCRAESVIIAATSYTSRETKGTAVCIHSGDHGSVLLTCKHVVEHSPASVWVKQSGDWHRCSRVYLHPSEDIAMLEIPIRLKSTPLAEDVPIGAEVVVDGAGPALARTGGDWFFKGVATEDGIKNDDGLAVIHGDSGGPVYVRTAAGKYAVGGIAYACTGSPPGRTRADHGIADPVTLYTPCSRFYPWVQNQYCPQGNCPIQIRPQVVYPVGPLGFQRGPSRAIGIAEPVPQQYTPVPASPIRQIPDPISMRGPAGPPGPPGEPGRSVRREEVEACVNAWLDSNIDRIRGPQGPQGPQGPAGVSAESSDFDSRLTTLEQRPFRIILASDGETIDDETYGPGEPVVLDLKRLRSVSGGK